MGHPRKARKKYDTPSHPWNADRIKQENKLVQKYGLKNKKEVLIESDLLETSKIGILKYDIELSKKELEKFWNPWINGKI